ncbi:MAG: type I-E CRISPR-associated protein Cse1/CasA [Myxococcales bacterium]|nr:type I-E CRISPR-associated protein Cse1/CasA [Myxococcales bacterium]
MNLLTDPWLPVERRSGRRESIRPAELTAGLADDPIVRPGAPRPDFDGAVLQFLVGLLQTAFAPRDDREWAARFDAPPTPAELDAAFEAHRAAFELAGDGPRFMQDLELDPASTSATEIRQLLIDAPGENTLKNNADTFVRGDTVARMSRASAALALFTLQINAPSGGAGHRTGLRGGGPLTTMLLAGEEGSLWETCWLNVLPSDRFVSDRYGAPERTSPVDIFPWLAPTRTSEKAGGSETLPVDMHPAHVYWSTPRRIRLAFEPCDAPCDIDGTLDEQCASQYATIPWGINYTGPWRHPLTPAVMNKKGERINRTMSQGGLLWRDWPALVVGGENSEPADVIAALFETKRRRTRAEMRVAAFGYDMDNMKARCWYRADMPLIHIEPEHRDAFRLGLTEIVEATKYLGSVLGQSVLEALGGRGSPRGKTLGDATAGARWARTGAAFYDTARALRDALARGDDGTDVVRRWHPVLTRVTLRLFDTWVDIDQRIHVAPRAVVDARRALGQHLYGKKTRKLLRLPEPAKKQKKPSTSARKAR